VRSLDYSSQNMPQSLGDGLVMRWATRADTAALVEFNGRIFGEPDAPDEALQHWLRETMEHKQHPNLRAEDFLVVVDENQGGKLVSSLNLISQTWEYAGIPFGVGQPEAVGTDAPYRRKGLVRKQLAVVHARSAARGELVQVISGIRWYYRQFGYGMALDMDGARRMYWPTLPDLGANQIELYRQRPATPDDVALLIRLYPFHCHNSLVNRVRDEADWRYELSRTNSKSASFRQFWVVEDLNGQAVAYYEARDNDTPNLMLVRELGVESSQSWRGVAEFVCRALKAQADELNKARENPLSGITFSLGTSHPAYAALGRQLERQDEPYAWYVRVADLPAFVRKIGPVLEKRLAASPIAGYTGSLRLNFYRSTLKLDFEAGHLTNLGSFEPDQIGGGDAGFPDLTFLEILFGRRSLDDLRYAFPDCFAKDEITALLVNSLFPKQPSWVVMHG